MSWIQGNDIWVNLKKNPRRNRKPKSRFKHMFKNFHQQFLLQQAERPAFSLPSTPLWSSDLLKRILLLYVNACHHSFLPHYHREHKISHKIPREMQKIYIKLQSVLCLSASALDKFLSLLGEESSGYTMEGGKTWTEIINNRHRERPKPAWTV